VFIEKTVGGKAVKIPALLFLYRVAQKPRE
jgi:hypothetical protein